MSKLHRNKQSHDVGSTMPAQACVLPSCFRRFLFEQTKHTEDMPAGSVLISHMVNHKGGEYAPTILQLHSSHVLNPSSRVSSQNPLHKTLGPIGIAFKMLIMAALRMWTFSLKTSWIIFTDELM